MHTSGRGDKTDAGVTSAAAVASFMQQAIMEVNVTYLGDAQFEAEARGHKVICDQPESNGGANEGMTPPEFLLVSLATCAAYYAVEYLKIKGLPRDAVRVSVSAGKAKNPARLDPFAIRIETPGVEDPQHLEGVRRAAEKCLVKNTMLNPPAISVEVVAGAPA
jgi:uncharacterized OsmC-like protein